MFCDDWIVIQVQAIPYVLSCLEQCKTLHLDLLAAEAVVVLAKLWIDLNHSHAQHAIDLISIVLPLIEAQGTLMVQSEAQFTMAECMLCTFQDEKELLEKQAPVLELLRLAAEGFETVECWRKAGDVYYYLAQIYNQLGCEDLRNEAALAMTVVDDMKGWQEENTKPDKSQGVFQIPQPMDLDDL